MKKRIKSLCCSLQEKVSDRRVSSLLVVSLILVVLLEYVVLTTINPGFSIYFLDVGQGDSMLIRTPQHQSILVDGGEYDDVLEHIGRILPFWEKKIDIVIGTHADADHIGGLISVMEAYEIGAFYTSNLGAEDQNLRKIHDIIEKKEIPIFDLNGGDELKVGEFELDVLWPENEFVGENDNQDSVVLRGRCQGVSFLLTGDIELEQEHQIVGNYSGIRSSILKVSHHGSKTATSDEFLDAVQPIISIISCGEDNKFGHPDAGVVERIERYGGRLIRTDEEGSVELKIENSLIGVSK